ncbi:jg24249 [Pararge aegeria aegeria]|uniref:Jg24249 protein n=1 Tax=Pararge aegeria aegeria TaxID=348720 RepID=A0A8S4R165_9NEOP|nr:jg24249 [Pararge aegeria aegeria]
MGGGDATSSSSGGSPASRGTGASMRCAAAARLATLTSTRSGVTSGTSESAIPISCEPYPGRRQFIRDQANISITKRGVPQGSVDILMGSTAAYT